MYESTANYNTCIYLCSYVHV